jgi:hypothetical protein
MIMPDWNKYYKDYLTRRMYMFKKFLLPTLLFSFSFFSFVQPGTKAEALQKNIAHINQQITIIACEIQVCVSLLQRTEKHFQAKLKDYFSIKNQCWGVLVSLIKSPEFTTTIEKVTTLQEGLIVDEQQFFNDIVIDPYLFPLQEKMQKERSEALFDPESQLVFNAFYLGYSTIHAAKILLKKLQYRVAELNQQLLSCPSHHEG